MGLFKSKHEQQLDIIIRKMEMNMSNNYKDNAQENLKEFEKVLSQMKADKLLKEKALKRYEIILSEYKSRMEGYSHKDQKPYWT